jgi:lysophospholipase L1-like esterase
MTFAQSRAQSSQAEHWVATWATAQQLMPGGPGRGGRGGAPPAQNAAAPNAAAPNAQVANAQAPNGRGPQQGGRGGPQASNLPAAFADQTVRQIVHTSIGGRRIRVSLSNMFGAQQLEVGAAHVAVHKGGSAIVDGTDRVLTFGGSASFAVQPGMLVVSDPVDIEVAPLSDLAISLYLPHDTGAPTNHQLGLHSAYISQGDVTGAATMPDPTIMFAYAWISSVDVVAPANAFTVVALGDSITDGFTTTRDANQAWPTLLARRLNANKTTQNVAVVNEGISGNQVLRDGAGISALARFDRDVLSRPGVKWVILLEGINDINIRGRVDGPNSVTADELIWGYRQLIARCHEHGIKIIGATVMPDEGVPTYSERGEGIRQTVNQWIRAKGNFDAVVDFDAVVRDPQRPIHIKAEFDPGDHIHPNDLGNKAMADAFDLNLFKK